MFSFLSAQQVKDCFKLVEHSWASVLIIYLLSALHGIEIYHHFSPLHTDSLALTSFWTHGSEFGKRTYTIFCFTNWIFNNSSWFQAVIRDTIYSTPRLAGNCEIANKLRKAIVSAKRKAEKKQSFLQTKARFACASIFLFFNTKTSTE